MKRVPPITRQRFLPSLPAAQTTRLERFAPQRLADMPAARATPAMLDSPRDGSAFPVAAPTTAVWPPPLTSTAWAAVVSALGMANVRLTWPAAKRAAPDAIVKHPLRTIFL
mmetsp:Transcript_98505/g.234523  ORF Transcript_98505/g.234523 Transcript_98505/m.234523 type:complete len:111 (+) Transcript_98505:1044-1376(+)